MALDFLTLSAASRAQSGNGTIGIIFSNPAAARAAPERKGWTESVHGAPEATFVSKVGQSGGLIHCLVLDDFAARRKLGQRTLDRPVRDSVATSPPFRRLVPKGAQSSRESKHRQQTL